MRTSIRRALVLGLFGLTIGTARAQDDPILSLDLPGHTAAVTQVLFAPGGRELISVGEDKVVRVWSTATGESLRTIRGQIGDGPSGKLYAAALSPDGQTLAVGGFLRGGDGKTYYIRLIDPNTGHVKRLISGLSGKTLALAFSPNGESLVSGDSTGTVRISSVRTDDGYALKAHTGEVYGVAFSLDGGQVASASRDGTVRLWDLRARKSRALEGKVPLGYRCLAWSPDGRWIAGGGLDGTIHIWDGQSGTARLTLKQEKYIDCLTFSPDSGLLAAGLGSDDTRDLCDVRLWSVSPAGVAKTPVGDFPRHNASVEAVAFSPDGSTVASAGGLANDIFLWTHDGTTVKQHMASTGSVTQDIAWSPDSTRITWKNQTAGTPVQHTFNLADRSLIPNPDGAWQGGVATKDGATLSLGDGGATVLVSSGGRIRDTSDATNRVRCFTWTTDGSIVVGWRFGIKLYQRDGTFLRNFIGHTSDVSSVSASPDGKYLASTSADQTVRIWPLSEDAASDSFVSPLLSLFVGSDQEWVAWTHRGYYTCSSNGENIMGWQINQGDDKAADFYPASRFHKLLFQDDILGHLLAAGSEKDAIALADKGLAGKTDLSRTAANIPQFAPPTVEIVDPADGATIADASVTLKVRITDPNNRKLSSLKLTDNEREIRQPGGETPTPQAGVMTLTAPLQSGDNTLSIVVANDAGAQSVPVTVKVTYGASAPPKIGTPTLYLISIGVSQYLDSDNTLRYPAKDAADITNLFQSQQGPGKMFSKVVVLSKLLDHNASHDAIISSLVALSKQAPQMGPNDYTVVFVAGHGTNDDQDDYYFAPFNIDVDNIDGTGVPWLNFSRRLSQLPGKVILMLDTCHSAGVNGKIDKKDGYGRFLIESTLARYNNESPIITFASCGKGQESRESPVWNNGAFTKALVEGLSGQADTNHDGVVTIKELSLYLKQRVSELTKQAQLPELNKPASVSDNLPLAVVGPVVSHTASGTPRPLAVARAR